MRRHFWNCFFKNTINNNKIGGLKYYSFVSCQWGEGLFSEIESDFSPLCNVTDILGSSVYFETRVNSLWESQGPDLREILSRLIIENALKGKESFNVDVSTINIHWC